MIRNFIEQLWFRWSKIPTLEEALKKLPDGRLHIYSPLDFTIGELERKEGWVKEYNPKDPLFQSGRGYDPNLSDPKNIKIFQDKIELTQPKDEEKDAFIQSNFTFKHGTVRAIIKLPKVKGAWSAFWLFGENGMPEHDILEQCGDWENKVSVTHHWGYDYNNVPNPRGKKMTRNNKRYNKNFRPTEDYYLYEVELSPYKVVYRINGIKVRTMKKGVSSSQQRVIFSVTKGNYCQSKTTSILKDDAAMSVKRLELWKII